MSKLINNGYLAIIYIFAVFIDIYALEAKSDDAEIQNILEKYFNQLPDVESKYIVNEGLAKIISNYFNYKVNAFPLFRLSVKYDRKPIKIPWTLDQGTRLNDTVIKNRYKYIQVKKSE